MQRNKPYTIKQARYSKAMMLVICPSPDGFKTRAARLAESYARHYTHREGGYILSKSAAVKFEADYKVGFDANAITGERYVREEIKRSS